MQYHLCRGMAGCKHNQFMQLLTVLCCYSSRRKAMTAINRGYSQIRHLSHIDSWQSPKTRLAQLLCIHFARHARHTTTFRAVWVTEAWVLSHYRASDPKTLNPRAVDLSHRCETCSDFIAVFRSSPSMSGCQGALLLTRQPTPAVPLQEVSLRSFVSVPLLLSCV